MESYRDYFNELKEDVSDFLFSLVCIKSYCNEEIEACDYAFKKFSEIPGLKVEKIMMDEEIENGIDSDVIDLISANIINERNPTCYGTDRRWANHLYPVFLSDQGIS